MTDPATDPVELTAALVRCPSVTPDAAEALALLDAALTRAGFRTARADRNGVPNLFARWGEARPVLGFNGHLDVVPPGDPAAWTRLPFSGAIADGELWGRGSVDMKSGVAAFAAAAIDLVRTGPPAGSIALLITGDEEGRALDGTLALLDWMAEQGERLDHCLVGEPTSAEVLGDTIKIGRRGSMTAHLHARGIQGHSAYPERARNPLTGLVRLLDRLAAHQLDAGTRHFGPSTLAITTVDTGNPATNVIPAEARATVNLRFNDAHTSQSLAEWIEAEAGRAAAAVGVEISTRLNVSGEAFLTEPGPFTDLVGAAIEAECGRRPAMTTGGGTSDARFVKDHCPVVEVGLVGRGMHAVDERVPVEDICGLKAIYSRILADYFAANLDG